MSQEVRDLRQVVRQALTGRGAHVLTAEALDGLDWTLTGRQVEGLQHTVFQIVGHLVYWQRFSLAWIDGEKPPTPARAADSWPGSAAPTDEAEWIETVAAFRQGLAAFEQRVDSVDLSARRGPKTILEIVQLIASHNSYHIGQIVDLRRSLGSWPPPSGGATW